MGKGKKNKLKTYHVSSNHPKILLVLDPWGSPGHPGFFNNVMGWFKRMLEDDYPGKGPNVIYTQSRTHNNILVELDHDIDVIPLLGAHYHKYFLLPPYNNTPSVSYIYEYNYTKQPDPGLVGWLHNIPPDLEVPNTFPVKSPYPTPFPAPIAYTCQRFAQNLPPHLQQQPGDQLSHITTPVTLPPKDAPMACIPQAMELPPKKELSSPKIQDYHPSEELLAVLGTLPSEFFDQDGNDSNSEYLIAPEDSKFHLQVKTESSYDFSLCSNFESKLTNKKERSTTLETDRDPTQKLESKPRLVKLEPRDDSSSLLISKSFKPQDPRVKSGASLKRTHKLEEVEPALVDIKSKRIKREQWD